MVSNSVVESHASLQLRYVFCGDESIELIGDGGFGPRLRRSKGLKITYYGLNNYGLPLKSWDCMWVLLLLVDYKRALAYSLGVCGGVVQIEEIDC
ncbi:hypothetical protein CMV_019267 [Castanea mollissima]|uniref:Uncharacterized protein n=1 Tax=Castanea mollissima TaxID=60419 RepID=A0A8J4QQ45_9ROSI|nr:hypothetical protein CMV_019267 [Castanea mollissima]